VKKRAKKIPRITPIEKARRFIRAKDGRRPDAVVVLGSGLGFLGDEAKDATRIPYGKIPGFPVSTVEGHAGRLVIGKLAGRVCAIMQGRFHHYEGYTLAEVAFPLRALLGLGEKNLVITNAAGGINTGFTPGDLMIISDHINLMTDNPLVGPNDPELGPRFPDMSESYDPALRALAFRVSGELGIPVKEGVYGAMGGPSYETPAEIRMLRLLGADAVGMSTVPEVIAANHMGARILGISCITNMGSGILHRKLDHAEVTETAERVKVKFGRLVKGIIERM
jgi:purine-nucleoside phosphorylase